VGAPPLVAGPANQVCTCGTAEAYTSLEARARAFQQTPTYPIRTWDRLGGIQWRAEFNAMGVILFVPSIGMYTIAPSATVVVVP